MLPSYLENKERLYQQIVCSTASDNELRQSLSFNMTSASLANFMPGIPGKNHLAIYKQILFHQQLSLLDQAHPEQLSQMKVEPDEWQIVQHLRTQPSIIVTFHTGSYRLLNVYLLRHRIPFSLVLASEVLKQRGLDVRDGKSSFGHNSETPGCIDAEKPHAALQMIRTLRQGKSLVVYIDGNTGTATARDHLLSVPFLHGKLSVRKGIAVIAHKTGCPIHCLATHYDETGKLKLQYVGRISPVKGESKEHGITRSINHIYNHLAHIVRRYPGQWEGWLYLHKSVLLTPPGTALRTAGYNQTLLPENLYKLNSDEFGIFMSDGQYFLLHKRSYTFYSIDRYLFDCLAKDQFTAISMPAAQSVGPELLAGGVITPACLPV